MCQDVCNTKIVALSRPPVAPEEAARLDVANFPFVHYHEHCQIPRQCLGLLLHLTPSLLSDPSFGSEFAFVHPLVDGLRDMNHDSQWVWMSCEGYSTDSMGHASTLTLMSRRMTSRLAQCVEVGVVGEGVGVC